MKLHCRLNRLWCILPMCAFIAAFFIGCTISRSDSVPSSSSEPLPAATPAPRLIIDAAEIIMEESGK